MDNPILNKYKTFPSLTEISELKILNEFLLIINLVNIPGNTINSEQIEKVFVKYSGDAKLFNWEKLKNEIINYLSLNGNGDYGRSLTNNTDLKIIIGKYDIRNIIKELFNYVGVEFKTLIEICDFFAYYAFSDWYQEDFIHPTCYNTIRKILHFFAELFTPPSELAINYINYRIWVTDINSYNSLIYLRDDLVPNIMDLKHFKIRFNEIYCKQYDECIAYHQ